MGSAAAPASARGPVIAYLSASRQLQLYDSQAGAAVSAPALTVKNTQNAFAVSFDGRYIAYIAESDGLIHLFDRVTNAEIPLPGINIYTGGEFPDDLSVSDTGLIAFDDGGNVGVVVYNSATGKFVPTGLSTSGNAGPRDPVLSGDGRFLATTCITGPNTTCPNPNLNSTHATLFLQNLVTQTDTGLPLIDPNAGAGGTDEEHACVDANGGLVGADAVDTGQSDVYIFDRSTGSDLTIPGLNTPGKDTIHCVLSFGGGYVGVSDDNGVVRVYDVTAGSQIAVPSTIIPPIWFTAPFVPPDAPTITAPANGAQLTPGQVMDASYSCQDPVGGMGIASCAGPVATGSPVDTSTPGTHSFTVTATDVNGLTAASTSTFTVLPLPPSNTSRPVISGTAKVGQRLSASTGTWSGTPPISYSHQWQLCTPGCASIAGATANSFKLSAADARKRVRVVVTASNGAGNRQAASSAVGPIVSAGPTAAQVRVALSKVLKPRGKAAKIGHLLRDGGYSFSFTAPSAGRLAIGWYLVPKGAHVAKATKPGLVASASVVFPKAGTAKIKVSLRGQGRKLLKNAKRVKLTAKGTFTPTGGMTTSTTKTITLKP